METKPEIILCEICGTTKLYENHIINVSFKSIKDEFNYCQHCLTHLIHYSTPSAIARRRTYEKQEEINNQICENRIIEELEHMIYITKDRQVLKRKFQNLIEKFENYEQKCRNEFEIDIPIAKPIDNNCQKLPKIIKWTDIFN